MLSFFSLILNLNILDKKRIVLIGPGASGKSWAANKLLESGYIPVTYYTTRPKRKDEIDGQHYHFINKKEFNKMISDNKMYEYSQFRDWLYGCTKKDFYTSNLIVTTPSGLSQMGPKDRDESYVIYFDIKPQIRRERLENRNDKDDVERRMASDFIDFKNFRDADYTFMYHDFTINEILEAIENNVNIVNNIKD